MGVSEQFLADLRAEIGTDAVSTDLADRLAAHGVFPLEVLTLKQGANPWLPSVVVRPRNAEEVSRVMQVASAHGTSVVPFGGGSGIVGGTWGVPDAVILDLKRMRDIEVDTMSMTACVGPGLSGAHLEEALNGRGLTSGHYPQSMHSATVGGMVATAAAGTFSTGYGKMDDLVVALEVVLADGTIIRTPLQPKHSAGPNLNSLFVGSEGAFGVVTRVWLKVFPLPERRAFEGYLFPDTVQGLEAIRWCVQNGVKPDLIRLYDEYEAVPRLQALGYPTGSALLLLGFDGPNSVVQTKLEVARKACEGFSGQCIGEEPGKRWLRDRFSTAGLLRTLHANGGVADAIEVSAQWKDLVQVWSACRAAALPLCTSVYAHFSHFYQTGGSVYVIVHASAENEEQAAIKYNQVLDAILSASLAAGGNTSHHHGVGRGKVRWLKQELGQAYSLLEGLKTVFDRKGRLNPGVLGLGGGEPDAS